MIWTTAAGHGPVLPPPGPGRAPWPGREGVAAALAAAAPDDPVVLDLDGTLYLRNSTEAYLSSVRPRHLAALLLALLDLLRPWRLARSARAEFAYRDVVRVAAVTLLFPWSPMLWARRGAAAAAAQANRELVEMVNACRSRQVHVATFGFRFIAEPLLKAMGVRYQGLHAAGVAAMPAFRRRGKAALLGGDIPAPCPARVVAVTDSEDDADLLAAVGRPFLAEWPGAGHEAAGAAAYLPLRYIRKAKHAGRPFILHQVLLDDALALFLAVGFTAAAPAYAALACALLLVSFFIVYEAGYHENDLSASTREERPTLAPGAAAYLGSVQEGWAWVWGLAVGALGVAAALVAAGPAGLPDAAALGTGMLAWAGVLAATRAAFWAYNNTAEDCRIPLYLALQALKSLGPLVLIAASALGALLLAAQALRRWVPYFTYRTVGQRVRGPDARLRLSAFAVLLPAHALAGPGAAVLADPQFWAIVAWLAYTSRREMAEGLRGYRLLPRPGRPDAPAAGGARKPPPDPRGRGPTGCSLPGAAPRPDPTWRPQ